MGLQVLGLLVVVTIAVLDSLHGASPDVAEAVAFDLTVLALALFVGIVARFLWRGRAGARTPAIVWNVMLLPVAYNLVQHGQLGWGLLVLVLAGVAVGGCVLAMRS